MALDPFSGRYFFGFRPRRPKDWRLLCRSIRSKDTFSGMVQRAYEVLSPGPDAYVPLKVIACAMQLDTELLEHNMLRGNFGWEADGQGGVRYRPELDKSGTPEALISEATT